MLKKEKYDMRQPITPAHDSASNPLSRRRLFASASGLGAIAAAATLLPGAVTQSPELPTAKSVPLRGGGYTLSEHIKQYYKSTLI